jgi:hypothetical protein
MMNIMVDLLAIQVIRKLLKIISMTIKELKNRILLWQIRRIVILRKLMEE